MVRKKNPINNLLLYITVISITIITLLPLFWMFSSSLKFDKDVFTVPMQWIPKNPKWSNYKVIWGKIDLLTFTKNSFKLSVIITAIQVVTSSFAAYGFTKCDFKGRDALFFAYIATIAVPWQVYMMPQYMIMQKINLVDSHLGYILMQSFVAFGVFLVRQFYQSIPDDLLEAARIDGLNEYGIYFRIILPLSKPVLSTLIIFSFVTIWNDFMGPMIYFDSVSNRTIPLGIRMFIGQYSTEYGLVMATSVIALIPVFVVFLIFQRQFIEGIASSGIKE